MFKHEYTEKDVCLPPGDLEKAWYRLATVNDVDSGVLRPEIARSWQRCLTRNISPLDGISAGAQGDLREKIEENHLLFSIASQHMRRMYEDIKGKGYIVMLTDAEGVILSLFGDRKMYSKAESLNVVSGSSNAEHIVGTTAPGIARVQKIPIQVYTHEHYSQYYHDWCCSAAPILDHRGKLIGCLDISNIDQGVHPAIMLSLVKMTVRAIEMEMHYRSLRDIHKKTSLYFNSIVDNLKEALVFFNEEDNVVHLNKKAQRLLGAVRREYAGDQLDLVIPQFDKAKDQLRSGKRWCDLQLVTPQGRVEVEAHLQFLHNEHQEQLGIVGTLREKPSNEKEPQATRYSFKDFIHRSDKASALIDEARQLAATDITVLIQGESGAGKEILAQAMHRASARRNKPFVAVNSAAMPRELIQSELFGYEEGAFTGAGKGGKAGKFEQAHGGTLFLDEIGDMPLEAQANLLRVLQEKQIVRIGGSRPAPVDVRIIAATNQDLRQEALAARFRQDLYYRLAVINLHIPPLRERKEDIEPLLAHLLKKHSPQMQEQEIHVTKQAREALVSYHWPGNVRELENTVISMLYKMKNCCIGLDTLPAHLHLAKDAPVPDNLQSIEMQAIESAMKQCGNNISKTARLLGINRATLYRKMEKYQIRVR